MHISCSFKDCLQCIIISYYHAITSISKIGSKNSVSFKLEIIKNMKIRNNFHLKIQQLNLQQIKFHTGEYLLASSPPPFYISSVMMIFLT